MLIDFHVHLFPETVKKQREKYISDENFSLLYKDNKSKIIDLKDAMDYMNKEKISRICTLGFSWKTMEMTDLHNDYILECSNNDERIIPFASVPSVPVENIDDYITAIKLSGFKGIGELAFYNEEFTDVLWNYIECMFDSCQRNFLVLVLHVNEPVGHEYSGKYFTDFNKLALLIQKYPDLKIVLSHWGGGIFIYELMQEMKTVFQNVYYDTAASPYLYDSGVFKHAAGIVGIEKILFGTDYPLLGPSKYLISMKSAGLSAEEIEQIIFFNSTKLLGLNH